MINSYVLTHTHIHLHTDETHALKRAPASRATSATSTSWCVPSILAHTWVDLSRSQSSPFLWVVWIPKLPTLYMYIQIRIQYLCIYINIHTYITLHYITLHYNTIHYITLHYITIHCITLHYITLQYNTLHYNTIHYIHTHIHWHDMCVYIYIRIYDIYIYIYIYMYTYILALGLPHYPIMLWMVNEHQMVSSGHGCHGQAAGQTSRPRLSAPSEFDLFISKWDQLSRVLVCYHPFLFLQTNYHHPLVMYHSYRKWPIFNWFANSKRWFFHVFFNVYQRVTWK